MSDKQLLLRRAFSDIDPQLVNGLWPQLIMIALAILVACWLLWRNKLISGGLLAVAPPLMLALPNMVGGAGRHTRGLVFTWSQVLAIVLVLATIAVGASILWRPGNRGGRKWLATGGLIMACAFYSAQYWLCQWEWMQYHFPTWCHWTLIGMALTSLGLAAWRWFGAGPETSPGRQLKNAVVSHRRA